MRRRHMLAAVTALAGCQTAQPVAQAPRRDAALPLERIALVSCIDQNKPQPIWRSVLDAAPQLAVFGGDSVYASAEPWSRAQLDAAYATLAADADFARLRRELPALAIWDDNDYGSSDGGAEFAHKAESKAAFLDFWQVPADSDRRRRDGLHFAYTFGPPGQRVQVILLDTRWWRSPLLPSPQRGASGRERYVPDPDPAKTMLGDAQWRWLELRLSEQADVRLVVSSIQVLAEGHGFERWGNLPLERQRLVDAIARTRADGVVFFSGDRHLGGLYREARGTPYPLYEITSSGITHVVARNAEPGPNRLGAPVTELHFGILAIDWAARRLALRLHGLQGQLLREQWVAIDELRVR